MSEKFQDNYKNIINDREFICLSFMRKWYYLHGFYEQKEFSIMEKRGKGESWNSISPGSVSGSIQNPVGHGIYPFWAEWCFRDSYDSYRIFLVIDELIYNMAKRGDYIHGARVFPCGSRQGNE